MFWRLRDIPIEGFRDYAVLVKWSKKIGLLEEDRNDALLREAENHPDRALLVLNRVIHLREALYRIIVATIEDNPPDQKDLDLLNVELAEMHNRAWFLQKNDLFEWGWKDKKNALDQMLWPILNSVIKLLTSPELKRIGMCKGEGCGWLYYDKSRNRSRKWCDMTDCGNRAKARRFYGRKRE